MSIVTTVAVVEYSPLAPSEAPIAFRTFLMCMMSRATIMSVRMMLSEREIEKYEVSKLADRAVLSLVPDPWYICATPITRSVMLANVSAEDLSAYQQR